MIWFSRCFINGEEGELHCFAQPGSANAAPRSSHRPSAPGRVEPLSAEAYKVTFTASRRLRDKLRQAQDLLGHQVPNGDLAEILERGLDLLMEDVKKRRFAAAAKPREGKAKRNEGKPSTRQRREAPAVEATPTAAETKPPDVETTPTAAERPPSSRAKRRSRYIPADVRRAVFERDGGQCTYADERGRRCPEKRRLEFDHAGGFARGAPHTVDGLRLRCRPHNQWEAERMYGRAFMEERRSARSSAPARGILGRFPPEMPGADASAPARAIPHDTGDQVAGVVR